MTASALGRPLSTLRDGVTGLAGDQSRPIPLSAMRVEVAIEAGLAVIATTRTFRNQESEPVEAVLTFPVPFDAVVTGLSAQVDGRMLTATAQAKAQARETYEGAVARGKLAILHEEALKGVHVLSVGQLGPGATAAVTVETVMPLAAVGDLLLLRLPMTVGELYGTSPLMPADDLVTGPGALAAATLRVTTDAGRVSLDGHGPLAGEATVPLDRSIVLRLEGGRLGERQGRDAFGRTVRLSLQPLPRGDGALDCAVLFDRSGSTGGRAGEGDETVWQAMRRGLADAAATFRPTDSIALWQFDSGCQNLGAGRGARAVSGLLAHLGPPAGGTELGQAIDALAAAGVRDIAVLTDGQTHASEAHGAAAKGCRVSAVLVGDGSLDAGVDHLATMTGGTVAWAPGAQVGTVIRQALESLRSAGAATTGTVHGGRPVRVDARRSGVALAATWADDGVPEPGARTAAAADAVGRFCAALALPLMEEEEAGALAAAHGLCTHLTSLVLVDEAGEAQEGLPAMRKVPLMDLARFSMPAPSARPSRVAHFEMIAPSAACMPPPPSAGPRGSRDPRALDLLRRPDLIDWATQGGRIAAGDLSALPPAVLLRLRPLAADPEVEALARALGLDPLLAVLALLAERHGVFDRHARRVAQRLLATADPTLLAAAQLSLAAA
ncbi:VIT domain-containing protein [Alsobacter sp. R-9]